MIVVTYSIDGYAIADHNALEQAERVILCHAFLVQTAETQSPVPTVTHHVTYSTENMIEAFRVMVHRRMIDHDQIVFSFEGTKIHVNPDATLDTWPKGFGDFQMDAITELVDWK